MSNLPNPHGTGPGQIGNGAAISTGDAPNSVGGKLMTHTEPLTGAAINRAAWAVSENTQHIWSRMKADDHPLAVLYNNDYTADITAGDDGAKLVGTVFCGDGGTVNPTDVVKVYDDHGLPLIIDGVAVIVTAVKDSPGGSSVFGQGFFVNPWVDFNTTILKGKQYTLVYGVQVDLDELPVDSLVHFQPMFSADYLTKIYSSVAAGQQATFSDEVFAVRRPDAGTQRVINSLAWSTALASFPSDTSFDGYELVSNGQVVVLLDKSEMKAAVFDVSSGILLGTYSTFYGEGSGVESVTALAVGDDYFAVGVVPVGGSSTYGVEIVRISDLSYVRTLDCGQTVDGTAHVVGLKMVGKWVYAIYRDDTPGTDYVFEWDLNNSAIYTSTSLSSPFGGVVQALDVRDGVVVVAGVYDDSSTYTVAVSAIVRASVYDPSTPLAVKLYTHSIVPDTNYNATIRKICIINSSEFFVLYAASTTTSRQTLKIKVGQGATISSTAAPWAGEDLVVTSQAIYSIALSSFYIEKVPLGGFGATTREKISDSTVGAVIAVDQDHLYMLMSSDSTLRAYTLSEPVSIFRKTIGGDIYRPYPTNLGAHPANLI